MYVVEALYCFDFDKNFLIDHKVGNVLADNDFVVVDIDQMLLFYEVAALAKFVRQRVLVNFLKKTASQDIANLKRGFDYFFRQCIDRTSAFIGVYRRL